MVALAAALVVEGAILHVWIAPRSQLWAWVVTLLNVATLLWLWRDHATLSRSAVTVRRDTLEIVVGTRLRCSVPRSAIASADVATWRSVPDLPTDYINASKPAEPNVMVVLREPVAVALPLGLRKRVTRIGLRTADPRAILDALQTAVPA